VGLNELFVVETLDNYFGEVRKESDLPIPERFSFLRHQIPRVNPLAGPIYVTGLHAGDLLVLEIDGIVPEPQGWTGITPSFGNLAGHAQYPELQVPLTRIINHAPGPSGTTADGTGTFNVTRDVVYPLRPFLGTITTAPERGAESSLVSQGPWGGNLDCRDIRAGNRIMLNTFHDGGLLFLGDVHAAQADSEYAGRADETAAVVTARCRALDSERIPGVLRIETSTSLIQVDSARHAGSMERALNGAFIGMMQWLRTEFNLDSREVYLQFSVNPDIVVHTYQFVGPAFYVVGVEFPKRYL
jgi:acetamidase/formamidase